VIRKLYGYHQVKFPMPLGGTAWAIMAERNAAPIAKREKKDLEDMYARAFLTEGIEYRAFPDPS
jgi:DNA-3-methyladenine glycosylase II